MNAWPLDGAIDTTMTYAPAHRARLALYLFPIAVVLAAASIAWSIRRSRRIRASQPARSLP